MTACSGFSRISEELNEIDVFSEHTFRCTYYIPLGPFEGARYVRYSHLRIPLRCRYGLHCVGNSETRISISCLFWNSTVERWSSWLICVNNKSLDLYCVLQRISNNLDDVSVLALWFITIFIIHPFWNLQNMSYPVDPRITSQCKTARRTFSKCTCSRFSILQKYERNRWHLKWMCIPCKFTNSDNYYKN